MNRFLNYIRATRGELKHVSWPTQKQTVTYTALVIVLTVITATYLGVLDSGLAKGLGIIIP